VARLRALVAAGWLAAAGGAQAQLLTLTEDSFGDDEVPLGYPVPQPVDSLDAIDGFRSAAALRARLAALALDSTDITEVKVGTTREDRDVLAYVLSDADTLTPEGRAEAAALINGTIHAREWASPEVVTGLVERFAARATDDGLYRYLLDHLNLVVIPVLNADGFAHTHRTPTLTLNSEAGDAIPTNVPPEYRNYPRDGRLRRKNMRDVDAGACPAVGAGCMNGVDLNRNSDSEFFGSNNQNSGTPTSILYRGLSPASEPETLALYAAADLAPRERLRFYVDVHAYLRLFFGVNTGATRRDAISATLVQRMSAATGKGPGHYPYDPTPANVGIGSTDEYFGYGLQIPAYTLEIEPRNGSVEYGGFGYHHDGFILPDSEIARVREELADALVLGLYRMAGPPALIAAEIRERDSDRVVYRAGWQRDGAARRLQTDVAEALTAQTGYRLWLAFDKPMRVRDAQGAVVAYPGQNAALAPAIALEGRSATGAAFRADLTTAARGWRNSDGRLRYANDAYMVDFELPATLPLSGARSVNLRVEVQDLSGQSLDADPATPVDWNAGWSGYEDGDGRDDTDTGGADRSLRLFGEGPSTEPGGGGGGAFGALVGLSVLWLARRRRRPIGQ
jgi:hypothetical protein